MESRAVSEPFASAAAPAAPTFQLRPGEIVVVGFAGGGGSSLGIKQALGRDPDVALNHDRWACAMHEANHPGTRHHCQDIWRVHPVDAVTYADPDGVVRRHKVGLAWFSPDCRHFSRAKGAPLVDRKVRDLAWVVVQWAEKVRPRIIMLENVVEFRDWGPLVEVADGKLMPCPLRKGLTFRRWEARLQRAGYRIEWRVRRACNAGAPTIRERLYGIARCDGEPIVWPAPTHGDPQSEAVRSGRLKPWRTAAEIIDWSIECPSIFWTREEAKRHGFDVRRPLAEATMRRVARGIWRFVVDDPDPFIVPITHTRDSRVHSIREGLRTQTCANRGEHALVTPFVSKFQTNSVGQRAPAPLHTVMAGAERFSLIAPALAHIGNGERKGQAPRAQDLRRPLGTMVQANKHAVIAAHLLKQNFGNKPCQSPGEPLHTVTGQPNRFNVVATWLIQHNTDMVGHRARSPVSTIVNLGSTQAIGAAHLMNMKGSARSSRSAREPLSTLCAVGEHAAEVCALLIRYHANGGQWHDPRRPITTDTTRPRVGLVTLKGRRCEVVGIDAAAAAADTRALLGVVVTIAGESWLIADVGMRMLTIRERFLAQGFPPDWIIDIRVDGKPASGKVLGRLVGNSVCPPEAYALVAANADPVAPAMPMEVAGD